LLNDREIKRVLIFTRTKHGADRVARHLHRSGIRSGAIHGNKAQNARKKALDAFRSGNIRALVATDVAARGIDIEGITHVINFELPNDPESYVHRIGRTARAGAAGMAISFCDADERAYLRDIEKTIRRQVPVIEDHPYHQAAMANGAANDRAAPGQAKRGASAKKRSNGWRAKARRSRRRAA
jgi:ATP-dependent RNA helicase RhlE